MSIAPEQIITAGQAMYRGSKPVHDDGCERILQIMVAPEVADALERHVRARRGNALMQIIAMTGDETPATPAPAARYESEAQALRESGWLARTDVLATLGTDDAYHDWITYQPSIVSGQFSETDDAGEPRNVACHVLRADARPARAGDHPNKPAFVQVPMTHDEHSRQHQAGETAVFIRWQKLQGVAPLSLHREDAHRWFDQRMLEHRTRWAERELCAYLRADRLGDIQPLDIVRWAQENALPAPDAFDAGVEVSA